MSGRDMHDEAEHTSRNPLANLSTKQKALVAGGAAAVVLGIWAATRNKGTDDQASWLGDTSSDEVTETGSGGGGGSWLGGNWGSGDWSWTPGTGAGGGGTNAGSSGGTTNTGGTSGGGGTSGSTSGSTTTPTATNNNATSATPNVVMPVVAASPGFMSAGKTYDNIGAIIATNNGLTPSTMSAPGLGNGGLNYNTASYAERLLMQQQNEALMADPSYVLAEYQRTQAVINNRSAANMDTSEQRKYLDMLEETSAGHLLQAAGSMLPSGVSGSSKPGTIIAGSVSTSLYQSADGSQSYIQGAITNSGEKTAVSTVSQLGNANLGTGGANYNNIDTAGKQAMQDKAAQIAGSTVYVAQEQQRTQAVIDNRTAAGLDVADQVKYQNTLTQQATASGSSLGNGGANYNTASTATKQAMVETGQKIASGDQAFISSEQARAQQVLAERKSLGLDTSAQEKYLNTLNSAKK